MAVTYGDLLGGVVQIRQPRRRRQVRARRAGRAAAPALRVAGFRPARGHFPARPRERPAANGTVALHGAPSSTISSAFRCPTSRRAPARTSSRRAPPRSAASTSRPARATSSTLEGVAFPGAHRFVRPQPTARRCGDAEPVVARMFGGVTNRFIVDQSTILTVQFGALLHDADMTPHGSGTTFLSPTGWRGNWFSTLYAAGVARRRHRRHGSAARSSRARRTTSRWAAGLRRAGCRDASATRR